MDEMQIRAIAVDKALAFVEISFRHGMFDDKYGLLELAGKIANFIENGAEPQK